MLLYILEENIFFFINHCSVTTCRQTDQEPVKLSKVSKDFSLQTNKALKSEHQQKGIIALNMIEKTKKIIKFWFCNQQDSFTNMIADGSAWCLMCQFRLK